MRLAAPLRRAGRRGSFLLRRRGRARQGRRSTGSSGGPRPPARAQPDSVDRACRCAAAPPGTRLRARTGSTTRGVPRRAGSAGASPGGAGPECRNGIRRPARAPPRSGPVAMLRAPCRRWSDPVARCARSIRAGPRCSRCSGPSVWPGGGAGSSPTRGRGGPRRDRRQASPWRRPRSRPDRVGRYRLRTGPAGSLQETAGVVRGPAGTAPGGRESNRRMREHGNRQFASLPPTVPLVESVGTRPDSKVINQGLSTFCIEPDGSSGRTGDHRGPSVLGKEGTTVAVPGGGELEPVGAPATRTARPSPSSAAGPPPRVATAPGWGSGRSPGRCRGGRKGRGRRGD